MLIHKLLPVVALGLNLLLLGSALASDRRHPRNVVFAYFASALAVWNLGVVGLRWTDSVPAAVAWEHFLHLGVVPIPVLFYHFVLAFLDRPRRGPALVVGYVLCGAFLVTSPTSAFIDGVTSSRWGFMPAAGPLYAPFFVYFQVYLLLGLGRLVLAYRAQTSSFKRNRTLLVIAGLSISLLGGAVDIVRFLLAWDGLYPIGIPSNAVFALALGVAIVRYRLMDFGALAKRVVLYLLTSLALAPVLFAGLWLLEQLVGRPGPVPGGSDEWRTLGRDALILLIVFAVALPLLRKLENGLEHLVFRRRHGVRDALLALSKELGSLLDLDRLGRTLTSALVERVPVAQASLHLWDADRRTFVAAFHAASDPDVAPGPAPLDTGLAPWLELSGRTMMAEETGLPAHGRLREAVVGLERAGIALLVPLFHEGGLAGVLVVGEKLSGEIFDSAEIELLEMLGGQAAIALGNARLYQSLRGQMDELQRTQDQLVQSAKLAAIGELAASVAHEVNNPLTVVLGTSDLLLRELPDGSAEARRVSTIVGEANRAAKIVRGLLDFARRREPVREPVAVHDLIDRALELLGARLYRAGIEVQRIYDPALPSVLADRDQITQVLLNLIGNAVDAMPDGGALVVETALLRDDDGLAAVISVVDSGAGIPAEQLERIFEPFFTTKAEGRGTGLGLSVSQGIARRHGGALDVDSKPGQGTTMRLRLPLA